MSETIIRARVDEMEKLQSESIFKGLGLTMSEAVRLFIRQVNIVKGLPFELKLTDEAAKEHDRWFKGQVESVLKEVNRPGRISIADEEVSSRLTARQEALLAEEGVRANLMGARG